MVVSQRGAPLPPRQRHWVRHDKLGGTLLNHAHPSNRHCPVNVADDDGGRPAPCQGRGCRGSVESSPAGMRTQPAPDETSHAQFDQPSRVGRLLAASAVALPDGGLPGVPAPDAGASYCDRAARSRVRLPAPRLRNAVPPVCPEPSGPPARTPRLGQPSQREPSVTGGTRRPSTRQGTETPQVGRRTGPDRARDKERGRSRLPAMLRALSAQGSLLDSQPQRRDRRISTQLPRAPAPESQKAVGHK